MAVRTFVALELSPPLKAGILRLADNLKYRGVRASWCRDETLHLTLKFLGDVEEADIPDVVEAVGRAAAGRGPFSFRSRAIGAFPSPARPRVIWVGVEPCSPLFDLQSDVERELAGLGFPREQRRWSPHITVGRVRDPGGGGGFDGALASLSCPEEAVEVTAVLVMKSTLSPRGAMHEEIARIPLGGAAPGRSPVQTT